MLRFEIFRNRRLYCETELSVFPVPVVNCHRVEAVKLKGKQAQEDLQTTHDLSLPKPTVMYAGDQLFHMTDNAEASLFAVLLLQV